jgi:hypothetical protein
MAIHMRLLLTVPIPVLGLEVPQIPTHLVQILVRDKAQLLLRHRWVGRQVWHVAVSASALLI